MPHSIILVNAHSKSWWPLLSESTLSCSCVFNTFGLVRWWSTFQKAFKFCKKKNKKIQNGRLLWSKRHFVENIELDKFDQISHHWNWICWGGGEVTLTTAPPSFQSGLIFLRKHLHFISSYWAFKFHASSSFQLNLRHAAEHET